MNKLGLFFLGLFLCSCTTVEFVRKDVSPKKQAVLRYLSTTSENKDAKYREEVQKKARNFCGGDYTVTKEYQARQQTGTATGIGTGFGVGMGGVMVGTSAANTDMYTFVEFECQ